MGAIGKEPVVLYFGLFALNTVLLFLWPPNAEVLRIYSRPLPVAMLFIVPAIVAMITLLFWNRMTWGTVPGETDQ